MGRRDIFYAFMYIISIHSIDALYIVYNKM